MLEYYGRLKKLWDDINDFDALPSCTCTGCSCGLNVTLRNRRMDDQVRQFLMGLQPCYDNVRSNLLGTEPLPSIHAVYSRLIQEEEVQMHIQRRAETFVTPMAFATPSQKPPASKSGGGRNPY